MSNHFQNKKILFIGPIFHNYHILIKEKLEFLGATVDFYPERNYGWKFKIINNFFNKYLPKFQKKHYERILESSQINEYDYLFVIRGYMLPSDFIEKFKNYNSNAKTIMYQWDSNRTNPFSIVADYFDKVFSFDFEDCNNMSFIKYLPLFYTDDLNSYKENKPESEYDFFFMGWCFPERYKAVLSFRNYMITNGYKLKAFLYMPLSSYIKEMFKGNFLDRSIVSFSPMSRNEYLNILAKSKVMVDVSNPGQTGLAMRVIEALAMDIKVLTNNSNLQQDKFIGKFESISLFDENNIHIDENFAKKNALDKTSQVMLSLEEWLNTIFKKDED